MAEIKIEALPAIVNDQDSLNFTIASDGLYAITITARCKNWWQNLLKLRFSDDDLAIKLDDLEFFELKGKKREFISVGSWNGNELKNDSKAVLFILPLKAGQHIITFFTDLTPLVEKIEILALDSKIQDYNLIVPAQSKAADLILKNVLPISLAAIYANSQPDKLLSVEKNVSGVISVFLFKKRQPVVSSVKIKIENYFKYKLGTVRLYPDTFFQSPVNLHSSPSTKAPVVASIPEGEELEVVSERVFGEYYASYTDIWHEVKWRNQPGYILSALVEIQGQERDKIIDLIVAACNNHDGEIGLMLAIAAIESRFKPYAVGHTKEEIKQIASGVEEKTIPSAQGVFQLRTDAAATVKIADRFDRYQNIDGGVRYYKTIVDNKDIKGRGYILEQRLLAWHDGPTAVAKGRINFKTLDPSSDSAKFIKNVLANRGQKNWGKIIFLPALLVGIFLGYWLSPLVSGLVPAASAEVLVSEPSLITTVVNGESFQTAGNWRVISHQKNGINKIMARPLKDRIGLTWTELVYWNDKGQFKEVLSDYFGWARWEGDFFLVERECFTSCTHTAFYHVQNNKLNRVPLVGRNGSVYNDGADVLFLAGRPFPTLEEHDGYFFDTASSTYNEMLKEYEFDPQKNIFLERRNLVRKEKVSLNG